MRKFSNSNLFLWVSRKNLSAFSLKIIAMVSMLIDHFGAFILSIPLKGSPLPTASNIDLWLSYETCRYIGRLSLPIFGFLLAEGFTHTGNKHRYLLRLGLFALISEIPFDLAVSHKLFDPGYQNVMLTFFFSFLMLHAISKIEEKGLHPLLTAIPAFVTAFICFMLKTDYAILAPILIATFYIFRCQSPMFRLLVSSAAVILLGNGMTKIFGLVPLFIIILKYNGLEGKKIKYFGYIFYPLHLTVMYLLSMAVT